MTRMFAAFLVAFLMFPGEAVFAKSAKPMTNQDVINLVHAELSQDSILLAIRSAKTDFDTSPDALIELNKQGVPDVVIQTMMRPEEPRPALAVSKGAPPQTASLSFSPEEMTLLDGSQRITMHYITPEIRTGARVLGFAGVRSFAVLRGNTAMLRVASKQPSFIIAVPNNAQPQSYFTLASFVVRGNGSREVAIGGGFMSYSSGIPKNRTIETTFERHSDQSHSPAGFTLYRVAPVTPMREGEYAMVVHSAQVRVVGFFGGGAADSFFDFRIVGQN